MSSEDIIRWQTIPAFCKQTIKKMVRSALPKRVRISDEFINAVNRCAQIYVLSVAATARSHYKTSNLSDKQIIEIIGLMGFREFVQPLNDFNKELKQKKSKTRKSKQNAIKVETNSQCNECTERQEFGPKCQPIIEDNTKLNTELADSIEVTPIN